MGVPPYLLAQAAPAAASGGDPSGVPRPVEKGRLEKSEQNSGIIVGETKTTATTGDNTYKTEFVKVYQDAGVVGVSMLTLLVLCLLLGMFCSRLIKMYIALTESRDTLEAGRTAAIEKLTTSLVLLRSETNTVIGELRREHDQHTTRLGDLSAAAQRQAESNERAYRMLDQVHEQVRRNAITAEAARVALEDTLAIQTNPRPRRRGGTHPDGDGDTGRGS